MNDPARTAVVLVSGGLDSATVLAIARDAGFQCHALSFAYGQRHVLELEAAAAVAKRYGAVSHRVVAIDLGGIGGSALTDTSIPVPETASTGIPVTYVPARNTVFLSLALAWAETLGASDLFGGVNAVDYSGYPDCRPEFLRAFEALASTATAAGAERGARFRVHAPLLLMTKRDIVLRAEALGVDLGLTHTCYSPIGTTACGRCDACTLRIRGFRAANRPDPIPYARIVSIRGRGLD
jgi:7-cyano-7-deazaguanine synthase